MHIFLLILKIIGIVLGSILGLLLVLLLAVLFVPIRYHIKAEQKDKFQCQVRVSWFLRCMSCSGEYLEKKFVYRFKVLGITIKSSIEKKRKKKDVSLKKEKKKEQNIELKKETQNTKTKIEERFLKEEIEETQSERIEKKNYNLKKKEETFQKTETKEEPNLFQKVINFISRQYQSCVKKMKSIKKKIKNMIISVKKGIKKIQLIWEFLTEEENRKGFARCILTLKKVITHIKPGKLKGYLKFGTEDPCITGQILAVIAMFYGKFGRYFEIKPDFENAVLEYVVDARGRVRLFTIGRLALQLWFSKELKKIIENYEKCKEELENGR